MARDTIFKSTQDMPPTSNSPDVVRTALSAGEIDENHRPAISQTPEQDVKHVERPVRGRPY